MLQNGHAGSGSHQLACHAVLLCATLCSDVLLICIQHALLAHVCVYAAALLRGRPSWELAGVVAIIASGLALLVEGEESFNMAGFVLVMTASCLSGFR